MFNAFILAEGSTGGGYTTWITMGIFALIIVAFYFFAIRPQKKQEREANEMRNALQVGDEITTIGGVIGEIVSIKDATAPRSASCVPPSGASTSEPRTRTPL